MTNVNNDMLICFCVKFIHTDILKYLSKYLLLNLTHLALAIYQLITPDFFLYLR